MICERVKLCSTFSFLCDSWDGLIGAKHAMYIECKILPWISLCNIIKLIVSCQNSLNAWVPKMNTENEANFNYNAHFGKV